ncbi:ATP-binding protein [Streptomyces sp. NBC_00083]|uniref:ATP-binding protein n=1 Tax=Streptomyces sp. NBC_00083 TaxID=2975647 RepID=UPI0022587824|nr:ATP-binding protein [Streptomyces sp. NBC_00083]MCX5386793.1 ATP-binding protein [Streptomyces sp. NBC_00083]
MSHLRAPAARPDRREGGRHGRSTTRPQQAHVDAGRHDPARRAPRAPGPHTSPEPRIRPHLLRAAVLPATVAVLCGAAAVAFTLHSTGRHPSMGLWALLAGLAVLALAALVAGGISADRAAKSVLGRANGLRRGSARSAADLRTVVEALRRGEGPPTRSAPAQLPPGADEFELLAHELTRSHDAAVVAVVQASQLSSSVGNEQKVEVFVNLARRLQSLVHREIQLLDELENEVEDPELLKGLFHVDHLATRIRRHAENLAVLGGAISRRQWSHPVTMTEVLRSSIAEVEQYPRVKLVPPIDGTLRGHAVADVIHLLAELVENATVFSAPHTQVLLRAQFVTAGLAVEVEDRGLGMPVTEQNKMNALLCDPDQVNVAHLLQDGRIGLFVVSALARRHGIAVRLGTNIYGGVQAVLVLPQELLGDEPGDGDQQGRPQEQGRAAEREVRTERADTGHGLTPPPAPDPAARLAEPAGPLPSALPAPLPEPAPARPEPVHLEPVRPEPMHPEPVHQAPSADLLPPPRQPLSEPTTAGRGSGPLPVRGAHEERPNPASASPGVYHGTAAESPEPRLIVAPRSQNGAVRGTMGRPDLPKRRSQEHLVPQLRDAPAPRRNDEHTLHDPGLMAAFQRGIGLAEAQQSHPAHPTHQSPTAFPSETDAEHSKE